MKEPLGNIYHPKTPASMEWEDRAKRSIRKSKRMKLINKISRILIELERLA
jgi:hypothetical protein